MMKIIDNALNDSLLALIQERVEENRMPWMFNKNSAVSPYGKAQELIINQTPLNFSFNHIAWDASTGEISHLYDLTNSMGLILKDLFELKRSHICRLRWGMTTTINKIHRHTPHIDITTDGAPIPHKVILFYLNDSDGDTYFYDKEHKIIDSVTPKENRAVLFDGSILHSSSKPIEFARRIVLNINLIDK